MDQYAPNSNDNVEAVLLTAENITEVVKQFRGQFYTGTGVVIPTVEGNIVVTIGEYLVSHPSTGRIWTMGPRDFEAKYNKL